MDSEATTLPNKGPYDHEIENLTEPGEGRVLTAFPPDLKHLQDPEWFDSLGRSQVEQRKVFTEHRPGDEQVEMVKQILQEFPTDEDGIGREWSVSLEATIKGSVPVIQYLVRERNLHVDRAPLHDEGLYAELHIASHDGSLEIVKVLVQEAGADVNIEHGDYTPLGQATSNG